MLFIDLISRPETDSLTLIVLGGCTALALRVKGRNSCLCLVGFRLCLELCILKCRCVLRLGMVVMWIEILFVVSRWTVPLIRPSSIRCRCGVLMSIYVGMLLLICDLSWTCPWLVVVCLSVSIDLISVVGDAVVGCGGNRLRPSCVRRRKLLVSWLRLKVALWTAVMTWCRLVLSGDCLSSLVRLVTLRIGPWTLRSVNVSTCVVVPEDLLVTVVWWCIRVIRVLIVTVVLTLSVTLMTVVMRRAFVVVAPVVVVDWGVLRKVGVLTVLPDDSSSVVSS